MRVERTLLMGLTALAGLSGPSGAEAQSRSLFDEELVRAFTYRNIGPFRVGARTSDVAVPASPERDHLYTFYLGFWNGGLWKTSDNGTTFRPVFDDQSKLSIGDVAIAPANPDIVWVGTGDGFTSRSSYAGDGVHKSTDAGETWTNMGLTDSHHIPRIVIHPTDPDIVYVAAMGHLYSENEERGVFKTTDGGESWGKVLYIDEGIGVIDLVLNPQNPDILYAATYDKVRLPWQYVNGGPGSGIYKTSDGGSTWARLSGGLPEDRIGRIGLDIFLRDPEIVYAVIENANPPPDWTPDEGAEPGARLPTIGGEVYRTEDGGREWTRMNSDEDNVSGKGPYYFSQIRVDPNDDQKLFVTGVAVANSTDGGRTWHDLDWPPRRLFAGIFGDTRTLWIDPEDSRRVIMGSDASFHVSYDGGKTVDHIDHIPVGEVYFVGVDMQDPYNVYAGLQDHDNWKGPSAGATGEVSMLDWRVVAGGDGMYTLVDPEEGRWAYTTRHYGGHSRFDMKLGYGTDIQPRREEGLPPYRFIWATPIHLSPHDSDVIYTGGQYLLKSTDRGDTWTEISPDLSTNPSDRIMPLSEGGVPGGITWFAMSSIAESPITPGVIWTGLSDGKVHVTRDGGGSWTDVTSAIADAGGREDAYVSRVRASRHAPGRAYVSKRGYKFDDFRPFLYRTDDYGSTWTSIVGGLPHEPINVVFEDSVNPDLLFVGNDTGVFVSIDGGNSWVKMNNNIPNVPVHDLLVHPREGDLVVGTYGRGIFITNVSPLQEIDEAVLAKDVHFLRIKPATQRITWQMGNDYLFGNEHIVTPNEPSGMAIRYYLGRAAGDSASISITDSGGAEVARLRGQASSGINTVYWDMRVPRGQGAGGGGGGRVVDPLDEWMPLGDYEVTLEVAGERLTQRATIAKTQGWTLGPTPVVIR